MYIYYEIKVSAVHWWIKNRASTLTSRLSLGGDRGSRASPFGRQGAGSYAALVVFPRCVTSHIFSGARAHLDTRQYDLRNLGSSFNHSPHFSKFTGIMMSVGGVYQCDICLRINSVRLVPLVNHEKVLALKLNKSARKLVSTLPLCMHISLQITYTLSINQNATCLLKIYFRLSQIHTIFFYFLSKIYVSFKFMNNTLVNRPFMSLCKNYFWWLWMLLFFKVHSYYKTWSNKEVAPAFSASESAYWIYFFFLWIN